MMSMSSVTSQASHLLASCFLLAACSAETVSASSSVAPETRGCHWLLSSARETFGRKTLPLRHLRTHVHIFHAHRPNQAMELTASRTAFAFPVTNSLSLLLTLVVGSR